MGDRPKALDWIIGVLVAVLAVAWMFRVIDFLDDVRAIREALERAP